MHHHEGSEGSWEATCESSRKAGPRPPQGRRPELEARRAAAQGGAALTRQVVAQHKKNAKGRRAPKAQEKPTGTHRNVQRPQRPSDDQNLRRGTSEHTTHTAHTHNTTTQHKHHTRTPHTTSTTQTHTHTHTHTAHTAHTDPSRMSHAEHGHRRSGIGGTVVGICAERAHKNSKPWRLR